MEICARVYRPRRARESPLFRLVEQHLEEFLRVYPERFAEQHRILERTRGILRANYPTLGAWLAERTSCFHVVPPRAGAIAYVRYSMPMNSTELVTRLKDEESVLLVPGDQFGMDGYLRIGFGNEPEDLRQALARIDAFLGRLPS